MNNFIIYYANGYFEASDNINITLLHMIDIGLIRIIFNLKSGKAWVRNEQGSSKEIDVPQISGL